MNKRRTECILYFQLWAGQTTSHHVIEHLKRKQLSTMFNGLTATQLTAFVFLHITFTLSLTCQSWFAKKNNSHSCSKNLNPYPAAKASLLKMKTHSALRKCHVSLLCWKSERINNLLFHQTRWKTIDS